MQEEKESWSSVASEHACRSRQFCVHCVHQTRLCRCSVSLLAASASPTGTSHWRAAVQWIYGVVGTGVRTFGAFS